MLFRANQWGWKATAARLLLAPLMAAGLTAPAVAQTSPPTKSTPADTRPKFTPTSAGSTDARPKFTPSAASPTDARPAFRPTAAGKTDTRPAYAAKPATGTYPPAAGTDPKEILRQGRTALEAGRFDEARALARRADSMNKSGRWGLFGDTPESLESDVATARARADRATAEQLIRQAESLVARAAQMPSEAERLSTLDQAYALADRAVILQGPTDFVDDLIAFGSTTPVELKKQIDMDRLVLRKKVGSTAVAGRSFQPATPAAGGRTPTTPTAVASRTPAGKPLPPPEIPPSGPVVQTAGTTPTDTKPTFVPAGPAIPTTMAKADPVKVDPVKPVPVNPVAIAPEPPKADPAKVDAIALVAEGRTLMTAGKLTEAKAKANDARKMNVVFGPADDTPDALMRDVMTAAKARLGVLITQAETGVNARDFTVADAKLTEAVGLAKGMGFLARPIEEQQLAVRAAMAKAATPAPELPKPTTVVAAPMPPVTLPGVPTGGIVAPTLPVPPTDVAVVTPDPLPKPLPTGGVPAGVTTTPSPVAMAPTLPPVGVPTPAPTLPPVAVTPPVAVAPPAPVPVNPGKTLLADAETELRRGELEMARKLAIEARNGGHGDAVKEDADTLLRSIDAEANLRKKKDASVAFKNAVDAYYAKQYDQAVGILRLIDADMLDKADQAKLSALSADCQAGMAKLKAVPPTTPKTPADTAVAQTGGQTPGTGLADQVRAMAEVEFQKFRSDGLDTESKAQAAFNRGETDLAIQMLSDFQTRVNGSQLSAPRQNLLLGPVERRLETFRIMKRQVDFYAKETADKQYAKDQIVGRSAADIQKKEEIAKKVRQVNELVKNKDYRKAEETALALKTLEPDDPTLAALYELAKRQRRVDAYQQLKDRKEEGYLTMMNRADDTGVMLDVDKPVQFDSTRTLNALARGRGDDLHTKTLTRVEREIELKLDQPFTVEFDKLPMYQVIGKLRAETGLNITTDDAAIGDELIDMDTPVTEKVKDLSLRNILAIVLDKARLKYVVENDVIRITTEKKARGRLHTKVFSVMDLVTPIPDFALADHANFNKAMSKSTQQPMPWQQMAAASSGGLGGGSLVGGQGANTYPVPPGTGMGAGSAVLENVGPGAGPLSASATLAPPRVNTSAQLMRMITGMVNPYSWQELGGPGKIDYYDIGGALVVNQTADVIQEVQDLLEALRRLQDLSVAVEVRLISLSEQFFEKVGVDFAMNIKTSQGGRDGSFFERGLTTGSFAPEPFINDIDVNNVTVGWNPSQGGFTPDLGVPIRPNSFPFSVPPFGGYPGPNPNGGLSLGLAFLNDIQVYMFLEAAQGDRRVQVMQAPKITLFNGQTASVNVSEITYFTLGLQVFNVGGQIIYLPQNTPTPTGVSLTVQAVVSADRRYVRLNMAPQLTEITSAIVPLFPVTAFITPVFEGGSQGVPIPFTQFFQQPSFQTISVQTTVAVPDGGTVVMGGLKTLSEGRNEFGPPVLSSIPYLNRLFRNQAAGRETRHIMIMVTPRIIINSEEELVQTGVNGGGPAGPPGSAVGTSSR